MNISNIIANPNSPSGFLNPAGFVFVIRCVPDIFTREQINIGVCAVSSGGQRKVKVITEAGRLSCFYGDSAINVVMLAQAAAEAAMAGAQSPSPQVVFDDPTPYFNSTLDDVVFSTFADQVTAAIPYRVTGATESISDEVARQKTIDAIKTARGLDVDFVANTPLVLLNTDSGPRPVYIPLQARRAVGTIRSSAYGPDSLKMHLLESVLDMEAAQRWRNMPAAGLFILRPPGKDKKHETAVERVIDAVAWRCNKSLAIEMEPTPERLAIKIVSWAETHS